MNRRRGWASAVLFLCTHLLCAEELPFTHFTPESGPARLPSASVQKVVQDHLGFIWLGFFSSGLGRYDGHSIDVYTIADGLGDLTIRDIVEDGSGRLWVGSETGLYVSTTPLDSTRRVRFTPRVGNVRLSSLRMGRKRFTKAADGGILVGEIGAVTHYRFDGDGTLRRRRIPIPTHANASISVVLQRGDGSIWIALPDGRFGRCPRGADRFDILPVTGPDAARVRYLFESARGDVWAGTAEGEVWRMPRGASSFTLLSVESAIVSSIMEGPDGSIWISTLGAGVLRFPPGDPHNARRYRRRDGLLGDSAWSILADHEQNLWIGQNGGLSRLKADFGAFHWFSGRSHTGERPVLPEIGTFAVLPPRAEASDTLARYTWVTTGGGVSVIDDAGASSWIQMANGLRSNSVYAITSDSEGRIWIGTARGLSAITSGDERLPGASDRRTIDLSGRRATLHSVGPATVIYAVRELALDGERTVCAAGAAGVTCLLGGTWYELPGVQVSNDVAADRQGHLWTASASEGVLRSVAPVDRASLAAGSVRFEPLPFTQTTTALTLHVLGDELWTGVASGLAVFSTKSLSLLRFFGPEEMGGTSVASLTSTRGRVWAAQNAGIVEIDARTRRVLRQIHRRDGLIGEEVWQAQALAVGAGGRIYCATATGVSIFDPAGMRGNRTPPPMRIRRLSVEQDRSGNNDISIDFAALSFANEARVRYRTRLAGYESEWSAPATGTSLRYTNLPAYVVPKRYVFEVQAANNDGVWSEPLRAELMIRPAWWRTWWAYLAYLALFVVSIRGFNSWRTRRLAARNRELAGLVRIRTAELRAQADELAALERTVEAINRETTLDQVFHSVLSQGMTLFPHAEKGVIVVLDREKNECGVAAVAGYEQPEQLQQIAGLTPEEARRRYSEGAELLGEHVFLVREHEFEERAGRDKLPDVPRPKAMLTMEVSLGRGFDAFVIFDNFTDAEAFTGADLQKLRRFRQHVVSAIEKARMLREVEESRMHAEEANRAKSSFLARMSHEIRTPLNAIVGFVQLMMRKAGRSADDSENLRVIMRSSDHLLGLINDVLSMAKIEAGQVTIHERAFSLRGLAQSVTSTLAARVAAKRLSLIVDVDDAAPAAVRGDEAKLRQVLLNLLDNAVKFTASGSVTLRVRWNDGRAAFAVEDTGAGMSDEEVATLFEAFVQTSTGMDSQQGTGLGLAICRHFIRLLGGEIRVQSQTGRGSTFTFDIPLAPAESVDTAAPDRRRIIGLAPEQPRYRILCVDDTKENCLLLEKLLAPMGFDVRSASNGAEAIEQHAQWNPDLIWMDVRMPVLDGYTATRRIREAEGASGARRTIVIALTASAFDHDRERFEAAGCDDFVAKPFLESTIFEKLSTHLGVRWTCEESAAEPAPASEAPLARERVARIPITARHSLRDALTRGDIGEASRAVDGVRESDPPLADTLMAMIRAYRFDDIQEALE